MTRARWMRDGAGRPPADSRASMRGSPGKERHAAADPDVSRAGLSWRAGAWRCHVPVRQPGRTGRLTGTGGAGAHILPPEGNASGGDVRSRRKGPLPAESRPPASSDHDDACVARCPSPRVPPPARREAGRHRPPRGHSGDSAFGGRGESRPRRFGVGMP